MLLRADPSPVVELNRAVAVAMRDGPEAGLGLIDGLLARGVLADYHLIHSERADLLRRSNRRAEAAEAYRRAISSGRGPSGAFWRTASPNSIHHPKEIP